MRRARGPCDKRDLFSLVIGVACVRRLSLCSGDIPLETREKALALFSLGECLGLF